MSSVEVSIPGLSLTKAFGASPRYCVLDADDGHLLDGGVLVDRLLDAARIDIVARADDEVLDAVDDEDEAFLVHERDVARAQELADHLLGGILGRF